MISHWEVFFNGPQDHPCDCFPLAKRMKNQLIIYNTLFGFSHEKVISIDYTGQYKAIIGIHLLFN